MRSKYTSQPQPGELRTDEVKRKMAIKALEHPTYCMVELFWYGEMYQVAALETKLQGLGYSSAEAQQLKQQYWLKLATVLDEFRIEHNMQNQDAQAYQLYVDLYADWEANR